MRSGEDAGGGGARKGVYCVEETRLRNVRRGLELVTGIGMLKEVLACMIGRTSLNRNLLVRATEERPHPLATVEQSRKWSYICRRIS